MAGQRLTDKTVTDRTASDDLYMVVDVSDTTGSAEGTSKAITADYVVQTTTTVDIDNTEFMALGTTGKVIVPAVASTVIVPIAIYLEYYEGATANTNTLNAISNYEDQKSYFETYYCILEQDQRIYQLKNHIIKVKHVDYDGKSIKKLMGRPIERDLDA